LFFVTVVLLVLVSVQLSYELSRHEMRIRRLAEEVALLRDEISQDRTERDGN
jgi:ABC-type molybdate transport system permease subunit